MSVPVAEDAASRLFDMLDAMEQGFSKEVTTDFTDPLEPEFGERRLTVERSVNRRDYELLDEWGTPLLVAKGNKEFTSFDIFVAGETSETCRYSRGAAFTLQSDSEGNEWTLASTRCASCASSPLSLLRPCEHGHSSGSTQVLAKMRHYQEKIGEGEALCMDVNIPEVLEGDKPPVWCPCCSGASTVGMTLTSRRPTWSPKQNSLALDFHGRCKVPSTKNFQLELPDAEGHRSDVKLLFGKVAATRFNLDISHPFSPIQAFAAALTVSNWT